MDELAGALHYKLRTTSAEEIHDIQEVTEGLENRILRAIDNEFFMNDIIEYIKTQGFIILTHTEVPEKYEGQGIGAELVHDVLEDLRAKKLQMIPQCPFIAQYIRRHPEWVDVVLKEIPAK